MKSLITLLLLVVVAVGCSAPEQAEFVPDLDPRVLAQSDFEPVTVVYPIPGKGEAADTSRPMFLITARQAYVIPDADQGSLKDLPLGYILGIPRQVFSHWETVDTMYGAPAAKTLMDHVGPAVKPEGDGTRDVTVSGGPLTVDGSTGYVGYRVLCQHVQPPPAPQASLSVGDLASR